MDDVQRKRQRTASPSNGPKVDESELVEDLDDPSRRNDALNRLLLVSSSHEMNYALRSDLVLTRLVGIVFGLLGWEKRSDPREDARFRSRDAWNKSTTEGVEVWVEHWREGLAKLVYEPESIRKIEVVLVILRNFSYASSNLRLLSYSPDILAVLVGCLYECNALSRIGGAGEDAPSSSSVPAGTLAVHALHTLINMTLYLDVTGQKLFCDKLFLSPDSNPQADVPRVPTPEQFGQASQGSWGFGGLWMAKRFDSKEDTIPDVPKQILLQLTQEYLTRVWSIFPALAKIFTNPETPRSVILLALELLQDFINQARVGVVGAVIEGTDDEMPSIRAILAHMPDAMLDRLAGYLYVPKTGPDAMDYVDPIRSVVGRVSTMKLMSGYEAAVDTDLRDRALDILVPLLELDTPRLAARIGAAHKRIFDHLYPILSTKVGRNDAPMLASQVLRELARSEDNTASLTALRRRLVPLASRDQRVADLVFNHL